MRATGALLPLWFWRQHSNFSWPHYTVDLDADANASPVDGPPKAGSNADAEWPPSVQVSEKERLVELAEALRSKMAYFDELERVAVQFHGASLDVDSDRFLPLLQRLDDCISCDPGS